MRISVAMCAYNASRFLEEQLSSISGQSRLPDEVVICDDGSQDDTVAKLQAFARAASFPVRIEVNKSNLGITRNFEQAISLCQGEIIVLSDCDDIWKRERLQITEKAFEGHPSAGVVFANADIIGADSAPTGTRLWDHAHFGILQQFQLRHGQGTRALLRHNLVTGASMAFRASLREVALPIPEIWIHDGWIALIASLFTDLVAVKEPLIDYRKHPDQNVGFLEGGFVPDLARAKAAGFSQYLFRVQQYEVAYERLLPHAKTEKQKQILSCIAAKIRHLSARARMPQSKMARVPAVAREFIAMRYTLYSRGLISALRDLFV